MISKKMRARQAQPLIVCNSFQEKPTMNNNTFSRRTSSHLDGKERVGQRTRKTNRDLALCSYMIYGHTTQRPGSIVNNIKISTQSKNCGRRKCRRSCRSSGRIFISSGSTMCCMESCDSLEWLTKSRTTIQSSIGVSLPVGHGCAYNKANARQKHWRVGAASSSGATSNVPEDEEVSVTSRPMNLVFVAAEVSPWSKTGGLGDVVGGLPIELARRGHKVMSIAPRYDQYRDGWDTTITVKVMGETVRYFHCHKKGVDRVFVDHPWFLAKVWGKTGSKLYGERSAADYVDNPRRFALFCRAAVEAVRVLPFGFGGDGSPDNGISPSNDAMSFGTNTNGMAKKSRRSSNVTFIANDWHSALVPVLLKHVYQPQGLFLGSKCALCVHNIAFQGRFFEDKFETMDLPNSVKHLFEFQDGYPICFDETTINRLNSVNVPDPDKYMKEMMTMVDSSSTNSTSTSSSSTSASKSASNNNGSPSNKQMYRKINWLKAGFLSSDKNLTVSPNYAHEITSGVEKGVELDNVVRSSGGIEGIVNGMDPAEWSPDVDSFIDMQYDATTIEEGKMSCKMALQAELGLKVDDTIPLIGFIGRLEEQKGVDIMLSALPTIINEAGDRESSVQIVVLGTGKKVFERMVRGMEDMSPNAKGIVQFSAPLAHLITAGADFMMVPSRFEPCGLIQLHAMRYGTVPIVSSTGGLVDTVKEGVTGYHIGSLDADDLLPEDVDAVVSTVLRATREFKSQKFLSMREKCINQDLTWSKPARKWEGVLEMMQFGEDGDIVDKDDKKTGKEKKEEVTTPAQEI